jgi:hypothetical protein
VFAFVLCCIRIFKGKWSLLCLLFRMLLQSYGRNDGDESEGIGEKPTCYNCSGGTEKTSGNLICIFMVYLCELSNVSYRVTAEMSAA